jgi:multiple sugar transport system substrate-binding protein
MMLGEISIEEGAKTIGEQMEAVLAEAGYYDGSKPLAQ